jgi:hypothetical protein
MNIDKSLEDTLSKAAIAFQGRGFNPPFVLLCGSRTFPENIITPHGEFRCFYDEHIPVSVDNSSVIYVLPMETYRRLRAQKAAYARWNKAS